MMAKQGKAKQSTLKTVPRLRFPGFEKPWSNDPLSKKLVEHKLKNTAGRDVFSVSMESGIVNQIEHLGRSFAASDTTNYNLGRRFDVVYTKSPLKEFPFGIVKQCKFDGEVALSPLYGVFAPDNPHVGLMIEAYFESPSRSIEFLSPLCQKGAKNTIQITNATFLSGRLPLPTEYGEQEKIANCLTSLDEVIAAQGRKVEALKAHKRGLIQQLFPREGEAVPRLRLPEFRDAPEWVAGKASDIVDVLQGYGFPERLQGSRDGEFPFYKVSDISACVDAGGILLDEANNHVNAEVLEELRAKLMPIGSTVFAKIGEAVRSNKRAITSRPCLVDNNAAGVKAIAGIADDRFVYYLWSQVRLIEYAGGFVPAVNKSAMEQIPICYPKPEEQQRIADCLSSLDIRITAESDQLATLKTHKQGLMQQLFPALQTMSA